MNKPKFLSSMSTSIPILPDEEIDRVVSWMKDECKKPNFNPNSPDFQAAIALVAATDKVKQSEVIGALPPEKTISFTQDQTSDQNLTRIMRAAVFRNIIRNYQCQPQIQRASFPTPTVSTPDVLDISSGSLQYLTPHEDKDESEDAFSSFRASFLHGVGQPPEFMSDRRRAILSSFRLRHANKDKNNTWLNQYINIPICSEIMNIAAYGQQINIRKDLVHFNIDPMGTNMPEYSTNMLVGKQEVYHYISPQHIGIKTQYDVASGADHLKQASTIDSLLKHAKMFHSQLASRISKLHEMNRTLASKMKTVEKEKKPKNSEYARLQALKKSDFNEYRRLVNEMKDNRMQMLLDKTDKYMKDLTDKIKHSHSGALTESSKNSDNLYDLGITLPDDVVQPFHLTGKLKDYQVKGLQWLVSLYNSHLNGILADEMGLGKTIQAIALLAWLWENKNDSGPHLVCAPLGTLSNWKNEFEKWLPVFNVVMYNGPQPVRKELQKTALIRGSNVNVVLTSFEYATRDKAALGRLEYSYLIIDEAHKLKNDQGKLSQALSTYKCHNRLLLTGTPLQNKPRELWALLNFVLPDIFNDHGQFEEWFQAPFSKGDNESKLTNEEQWVIINQLHAVLRPFLFRRIVSEVADELPEMYENKIICAMSAWQKAVYKTIVEDGSIVVPDTDGPKIKRLDNQTMQLKKVCNHPFLFYDTYYVNSNLIRASGKFDVLDRILPKLKRAGHRVLIFSQMTEVLNLLGELLSYLKFKYLRLDGSTKPEMRQPLINEFNDPNSESFIFLLSTRAGGLGLNLQSADTVIIYDNDWNPFADQQARSRVHRIGQEKPVVVINLVTANSVEEKVQDRADQKKSLENKIIEVGRFDDTSNLDDRKKLYQQIVDQTDGDDDSNVYNDDQINKIIARSQEEIDLFTKMDKERIKLYQEEWEKGGHTGKYPNLMQADELPSYLKIPITELQKESDLPLIRKSRSTASFAAARLENMSDLEYTKIIERGEDPEEFLADSSKKDPIEDLLSKVETSCRGLFDVLPTREENPTYYQVISYPITLNEIRKGVSDGKYENVNELVNDLKLMANNSIRFNGLETEYGSISREILQHCENAMANGEIHRDMPEYMSFDLD